ncbi:hypothetical protein [Nisaea sp.]|uniref:hypothetical protein n=1 Tax=Nisaea sp. TaxID=2024842 RepID=UPI003262EEE9
MTANTNGPVTLVPSNRREFLRRDASLLGQVSTSPDFSQCWAVTITNISLTGMRLIGDFPNFSPGALYVRLDGIDVTISGLFVSQNQESLRIQISLDDLQLSELVERSDVYTSLVLQAVPDFLSSR